jgi:peptidoglycan/xylan/chitin deacetylase (PgdA/CDA1 family)
VGPGPSDIPPAPGPDNVPAPSGAPGGLTVLDWAGFPAAVTYSFDDNDGSQLNYYDQMHAIGGRYTFYLVTNPGVIGTAITDAAWKKIRDDGNEIGNHTTDHNCGTANIDGGNSAIQTTFGAPPTTLAAPYGDSACASQAPGRVFINRGVGPAQPVKPLDNSNPFNLNCYIPATDQAASEYNKNIDSALSQKGWVIYVIHGIKPTSHSYQPVAWEGLKGAIEYAKSKNVWIDTMENIGSYWLGQKAFAAATTQMNGDTTTWTWTLPEKFPTGKYLRVKVDGGTLTQGGAPLTWDPHGYYEIELDKKTLTLAP